MKVIPTCSAMRQVIPEMDRIMRLEDHEASRKSVSRTIFDPGGYLNCFHDAQFGGSTGFLNPHHLLGHVLYGEELHTKKRRMLGCFVPSSMFLGSTSRNFH